MAKTNPHSSRLTVPLAFDEELVDDVRPLLVPPRTRSRASMDETRAEEAARVRRESGDAVAARPRRRAPVHHGFWTWHRWSAFLFRTRVGRILLAILLIAAVVLLYLGYRAVRQFLEHDPHFRIASSAAIQIEGNTQLTREDLLSVFGGDIGRNIFFVSLKKRQAELERVPWVAHATVMRLLPDELRVSIVERVPVAFVRMGSAVELVDPHGIVLHLPPAALAARHYSFPVVTGFEPTDTPDIRAERMQLYQRLIAELDHAGQAPADDEAQAPVQGNSNLSSQISSQISEVDLADLEDVRAVMPAAGVDILLHLGDSDFLKRYRSYQAHIAEWRQQYPNLAAVDLRYDRQVVLKMADGTVDEASSVDHGNSLMPAPLPAHHATSPTPKTAKQLTGHPAAHPAGHGNAHGWRPL